MRRFENALFLACVLLFGITQTHADDSLKISTKLIGMGSFEAGEFMKAEMFGASAVEKLWYQRAYMQLGFSAKVNERTEMFFVAEGMAHYNTTTSKDQVPDNFVKYLFYPRHMEGTYTFGNMEKPYLQLGVGIFPFKYNNDIRNFGGYLFRTGIYPPIMVNQFDYTITPLTGLRLASQLLDSLNLCAMLTSESQTMQLQDYNVSLLADYTFFKAFTIGGGVVFNRCLSINHNGTTPPDNQNSYVDTASGDTTHQYYSWAGTKLMGRIAFDPKVFIPTDIFGSNDLRLYAEIAVIGLKDYPKYYDQLWRRVPLMVGFNIPAFKIVDVLNVELELYRWNYPNSFTQYFFTNQIPRPDNPTPDFDGDKQALRWSFYAKRHIGTNFSVIGQIAFDHSRIESNIDQVSAAYYGDGMHKHGDWAWTLKTEFDF